MVKVEDLKMLLESTGFPVVYRAYAVDRAPDPPYLVFYGTQKVTMFADNQPYYTVPMWNVELYTDKKEPLTEARVEQVLDESGILYISAEANWEDERLYEVLYEFKQ